MHQNKNTSRERSHTFKNYLTPSGQSSQPEGFTAHNHPEATSLITEVYGLDGGQEDKDYVPGKSILFPNLGMPPQAPNGYVMVIASVKTNLCRSLFSSKTSAVEEKSDGMGIHRLAITISIHQFPQGGCALDSEENLASILHHPNPN